MTENIIFYSILAFFTIISLGMTWANREKMIPMKVALLILAPIVIFVTTSIKPELASFFDIRFSFGWPTAVTGEYVRLKGAAVYLFYIAIITYAVALIHVLIASKNRITRQATGQ